MINPKSQNPSRIKSKQIMNPVCIAPPVSRSDECLVALASETASKLDVLRLDGDTFGVDGTQVGVFKKRYEVRLDRLLERTDSG